MARQSKVTQPTEGQIQLFRLPEVPEPYKKAVEVLHSKPRAPMSLMHRKLLNAWLKNAVESKPDKEGWWSLPIVEMSESIGFDSNNRDYLTSSARDLMTMVFEWDIMAEVQRRTLWKASVLFPEVEITSGLIRYQISKQVQEKVLSPEIYALIDQRIIRQFRRGTSIGLYEFCIRYQRLPKTPEVPWETFRDMIMGTSADAKSYKQYKVFKDKVLKPAIAEVNTVVELKIELQETTKGRKVVGLYFLIIRPETPPAEEFSSPDELADTAAMVALGIPQTEATKLAKTNSHNEISAAIEYTRKRVEAKNMEKLDNPAAYLRRALAEKWAIVEGQTPAKTVTKPAAKKTAAPDQSRLQEACMAQRDKEAEGYFHELDPSEQQMMVDEYNGQQELASLKIKIGKGKAQGKAATATFYRWLAQKTWGPVTPEQLLEYANNLLFGGKSA